MPTNGLLFACDQIEYKLSATATSSGAPPGVWPSGDIYVTHADTSSSLVETVWILYTKQRIQIRLFGSLIANIIGTSGQVIFDDVRVYGLSASSAIRTEWSGWEAFVDGVSVASGGSGGMTSFNVTPGGVPIFGAPPFLRGSVPAYRIAILPGGLCSEMGTITDESNTSSATFTGGYRVKIDGTWHEWPISFPTSTHLSAGPTLGGSTTWNCTISLSGNASWTSSYSGGGSWVSTDIEWHQQGGEIGIIPDMDKSLQRMNADFALFAGRYGIPGTEFEVTTSTTTGSTSASDTITDVHGAMIEVLTGATLGVLDEPLEEQTYCRIYSMDDVGTSHAYCSGGTVAVDTDQTTVEGNYPVLVTTLYQAGYLTHATQYIDDYNRIANPYWSYYLQRDDWEVDGTPYLPEDYWDWIGTQWLYHPALPTGQQRRTRNTLLTEPLLSSPWRGFLDSVYAENRWLGVNRFKETGVTWPTSVVALGTGWTLTNCTRSGTSTHTLTYSGSGGSYAADWDMGQLVDPYMHPHICNEIKVTFGGADASLATAYLVGVDGSEVLLPDGTWQTRPRGTSEKHAGSWAEDRGMGVVTDQGVDSGTTGISPATMGDVERSFAFSLLPGRTAQYVRVKVAGTSSCTVHIEMRANQEPTILPEHRTSTTVLWANGPGVRVGSWEWWDTGGAAWNDPPNLQTHGYTPTAIDGLVNRRRIFEAQDKTTGLRTEIEGLWDMKELGLTGSPTDAQVFAAADYASMSFWKMRDGALGLYLVNAAAELPPIACLPALHDGEYAVKCWVWAQEPRYHVTPVALTKLVPSTGSPDWLGLGGSLAGWDIRAHSHALDNSETDYRLRNKSVELAGSVRPWHGQFWVFGGDVGGEWPSNTPAPWGFYARTWVENGEIQHGFSYSLHPPMDVVVVVDAGEHPAISFAPNGHESLVYERDGTVYLRTSWDDGTTWSSETSMATGITPRVMHDAQGYAAIAWFEYDSGSSGPGLVKLKVKGPGDASYGTTISVGVSCEDTGFDFTAPPTREGAWVLVMMISGTPTEYLSTDFGATWKLA